MIPAAKPLAERRSRKRSSCRRRSRRTTAASATSAARRSRRRGTRRRPTRRSRSPTTSPPISRNWPASGDDAPDREPKLREFCRRFAERAFRRPLTDEQKAFFVDRQFQEASDPETAVKRVVLLVLKSPRFLYREIGSGSPDAYRRGVAALVRALGLAARSDRCWMPRRPASSPPASRSPPGRAHGRATSAPARSSASSSSSGSRSIRCPTSPRTPSSIPGFDEAVASDLRTSLDLFLDDVIGSESADFRQLLRADYVYLERPAGAVLRRRPAARRAVPEGRSGRRRAGRRADPPLPDGELRLHGDAARRSIAGCSCRGACWAACCGRRRRPSPRWPPTSTRT